jgi:hypothetical protein
MACFLSWGPFLFLPFKVDVSSYKHVSTPQRSAQSCPLTLALVLPLWWGCLEQPCHAGFCEEWGRGQHTVSNSEWKTVLEHTKQSTKCLNKMYFLLGQNNLRKRSLYHKQKVLKYSRIEKTAKDKVRCHKCTKCGWFAGSSVTWWWGGSNTFPQGGRRGEWSPMPAGKLVLMSHCSLHQRHRGKQAALTGLLSSVLLCNL